MDGNRTQALRRENERKRDELFLQIAVEKGCLSGEQAETVRRAVAALRKEGLSPSAAAVAGERGLIDRAERLVVQQEMRKRGWRPLVGKYELLRKLGSGGMGTVYLARNATIGRTVALKILPSRLAKDATFVSRFDREAKLAARVSHPNVVQVLDADVSDGRRYLVMEHVEGETLQKRIEREGRLDESVAVSLLRQVALGLRVAHAAGIVHRDIKPANILIDKEGVPKIADLGIAKSLDSAETALTQTASAMGTPLYMAPEQSVSSRSVDARSDIYSLGATFYHALAGAPPFGGETPYEIINKHCNSPRPALQEARPGLSPGLCAIIERMIARAPEDRHPTCDALIEQIDALLSGGEVAPAPQAADGSSRPHRLALAAAVGGVALLLVGIGLGVAGLASKQPPPEPAGESALFPASPRRQGRDAVEDEWARPAARRVLAEAMRLPEVSQSQRRGDLAEALRRVMNLPDDAQAARSAAEGLRELVGELPPGRRAPALLALSAVQHLLGEGETARATRTEAMKEALVGLLRSPFARSVDGYADLRLAVGKVIEDPEDRPTARAAVAAVEDFLNGLPEGSPLRRQAMLGAAAASYLAGDNRAWLRLAQLSPRLPRPEARRGEGGGGPMTGRNRQD